LKIRVRRTFFIISRIIKLAPFILSIPLSLEVYSFFICPTSKFIFSMYLKPIETQVLVIITLIKIKSLSSLEQQIKGDLSLLK